MRWTAAESGFDVTALVDDPAAALDVPVALVEEEAEVLPLPIVPGTKATLFSVAAYSGASQRC